VITALIIVAAAVFAAVLFGVQAQRARDTGVSLTRAPELVVEVAGTPEEAERLCTQALREVAETITSSSFKDGHLAARSHLKGEPAGAQGIEFWVEPAGAARSRIRVKATAYPYNARYAQKRLALIDEFEGWLSARGGSSQSMS